MTALLSFTIFAAGLALGLLIGAGIGLNARLEMLDDLDAAEADIDRLRG